MIKCLMSKLNLPKNGHKFESVAKYALFIAPLQNHCWSLLTVKFTFLRLLFFFWPLFSFFLLVSLFFFFFFFLLLLFLLLLFFLLFFFSFSLLASVCAVQHLHSKWHRHDQTTFASKIENLNLVRFERKQLLCVNCFTCWSTNVPRRAETLKF